MFDNDHGMILMGAAISMVLVDHFRWKTDSKWGYFAYGMLFAFGLREFIPALVHWIYL